MDSFLDTPDTLWMTDEKFGEARTVFPRSKTQFTGGSAPTCGVADTATLTFRGAGVHVINLDQNRTLRRKQMA